jgi:hypothetical protein
MAQFGLVFVGTDGRGVFYGQPAPASNVADAEAM